MPIPEFKFTDSPSGLPPNPVPVRLACLVSEWSPYLLASILGQLERFTSLKAMIQEGLALEMQQLIMPCKVWLFVLSYPFLSSSILEYTRRNCLAWDNFLLF